MNAKRDPSLSRGKPLSLSKESNKRNRVVETRKESDLLSLDTLSQTSKGIYQFVSNNQYKKIGVTLSYVKQLGSGSSGQVYEIKWIKDQKMAFKKSQSENERDNDIMLWNEIHLLSSIPKHPFVIELKGICLSPPGIVQELAEMDLITYFERVHRDPLYSLSFRQMLLWIYQITQGLSHLMSHNIIHRDLAARNILLFKKDTHFLCKICDFGLSRRLMSDHPVSESSQFYKIKSYRYQITPIMGIPIRWMDPLSIDLRTNKVMYSRETDIWSLGVLFWEILMVGVCPYNGIQDDFHVLLYTQYGGRLDQPLICPLPFWEQVVSECWKDSKVRPDVTTLISRIKKHINLTRASSNLSMKRVIK